jgi:hypothetical protein
VRLDHQAVRDLQFLVDLPGENCCKAIWKPQALATIHTDASDTGWGAVMNNLVPAQGFFDQGQQALHITAKELLAVLNAVKMFQQELQQIAVRLVTDNMSVRAVINKGVSSSPVLMKIYRDILTICLSKGILLQAEYIPTHQNVSADALSRVSPKGEGSISDKIFQQVELMFGKRTFDRFASPDTARCHQFNSIIPSSQSSGDALLQSWEGHRNWVCPPIALVPKVVEKLTLEGSEAVVVAPYWPSAPWFPMLMELSDSTRVLTRSETKNEVSPNTSTLPDIHKNLNWRLMLVHIPHRERVLVRL